MKSTRTKPPIKPLPYWVYFSTSILLTLVGLGACLYLIIAHYRVHMDIGYQSFCAISRAINCDTVSQSSYAVLLGMPLAAWGCLGYLIVLILLACAARPKARPGRVWAVIQVLALMYSAFDLYLAWVSSYHIKSYCIVCLVTYGVNFLLLYFAWLIRRRFNTASLRECLKLDFHFFWNYRRIGAALCSVVGVILITGITVYPAYWQYHLSTEDDHLRHGITPEGRPWIGAQVPELVIEEYADYLCFQCAKMHVYLRGLVRRYPDKLRLVHYHFPMDKGYNPLVEADFHEGSGQMALLAIYAEQQGKFWEMNDLLFESGRRREPVSMRALGAALDLDFKQMAWAIREPKVLRRLRNDIKSGLEHEIVATPSYVVNGEMYKGVIPPEVLNKIME
jgi:uncharacterized membrane protein/predicted DsbA family dithiol-disulfide isomerase